MTDEYKFMRSPHKGAPQGVYRSGEGWNSEGIVFVATGEYRAPAKGEWYLSGAIIAAYMAGGDLFTSYWIARAYRLKADEIYHNGRIYVPKSSK
jgi:hypothetical protein